MSTNFAVITTLVSFESRVKSCVFFSLVVTQLLQLSLTPPHQPKVQQNLSYSILLCTKNKEEIQLFFLTELSLSDHHEHQVKLEHETYEENGNRTKCDRL